MSQICNPCAANPVCLDFPDRYNLQEDVYYFVLNCLPGFFCGGNNVIFLVCCDGTIMQQVLPQGITAAQREAYISELIASCFRKIAFCENDGGGGGTTVDGDPNDGTDPNNPVTLYSNRPQSGTSRCGDGSVFTYTVPAGLFVARTQELADTAARNYARTLAVQLRICLAGPQTTCCNGVLYSSTIVASGGRGNFRWSISGSLPTGLVATPIGHNGLRISGIPTTNGNYTFTVTALDSFGNYMRKGITIKVWGITDTSLPNGTLAGDYSYQLTTTNGTAPYTYSLVSGGFPLGVDISSSGLISGVVGEEGAFPVGIRVRDAANRTCSKDFTLTIPAGCPNPSPISFTIPSTPDKTYANATGTYEAFAAIGGTQKIGKFSTDTNLGCIDIVDFTAAPAIVNQFLMNAETGWNMIGAVYEPTAGVIVAVVAKAATPDRVAFFDPVTGYISSVALSTTSAFGFRHWNGIVMRGNTGMVAFMRPSVTAGLAAYICTVDAVNKTVVDFFTLGPTAGTNYGRNDFAYGCSRDEFYFCGVVGGAYRLFAYTAEDGTQRDVWDVGTVPQCTWVDSLDLICILRQNKYCEYINPDDGTVYFSRDMDGGLSFPFVDPLQAIYYDFILDKVLVGANYDELAVPPWNNSCGVMFLDKDTLLPSFTCKFASAYAATNTNILRCNETSGDVYVQSDETAFSKPFYQMKKT